MDINEQQMNERRYSKADFIKAAKLSEVSIADAIHTVSLLDQVAPHTFHVFTGDYPDEIITRIDWCLTNFGLTINYCHDTDDYTEYEITKIED